jgi:BirA family biotin operon repressor/biotin-[acetyl-CoA-carboxylase] ligase
MEMTSKERAIFCLEGNKGDYVSGEQLARQMNVSRNSVWKAIQSLREDGYAIESTAGRGYRLSPETSILSAASIMHYLANEHIDLEYHDRIDSTNARAKALAEAGAPEGTLVVANEQTAGRGRRGRMFLSPAGSGVYFSLILRPRFALSDIVFITSYAACCVAEAIDAHTNCTAKIKWVNDIFVGNRKVSGILTEAAFDAESQALSYAVVGIGINVLQPKGGFNPSADGIAGAITNASVDTDDLRAHLVASTVNAFMQRYDRVFEKPHLAEYRARSLLDGKRVQIETGRDSFEALVCGINDDLTLRVRLDSGEERSLASADVHIASSQLG